MAKLADQQWDLSGFIKRNWKPLFIPPALILLFSAIATILYIQPLLLMSVGMSSIAGTLPFWWLIPLAGVVLAATMLITQGLSLISKDKAILALDYSATHWETDLKNAKECVKKDQFEALKFALERQHWVYANLPTDSAQKAKYKEYVTVTMFNDATSTGKTEIAKLISTETARLNQLEKF